MTRLHLPFAVLSDDRFKLTEALDLPTFTVDGMRLLKRLTVILRGNIIETVLSRAPAGGERHGGDRLAEIAPTLTSAPPLT